MKTDSLVLSETPSLSKTIIVDTNIWFESTTKTYLVKEHPDSKNKYYEDEIINMLEFLVDTFFVVVAGNVFQQTIGIPIGKNCVLLLPDIFLY